MGRDDTRLLWWSRSLYFPAGCMQKSTCGDRLAAAALVREGSFSKENGRGAWGGDGGCNIMIFS